VAPGLPGDLRIIRIIIFLNPIVAGPQVRTLAIETPVPDHCNLPFQATEQSHTLGKVMLSTGAPHGPHGAAVEFEGSAVLLFSQKDIVKKL
jgi:hypothetical protein